MVGLAKTASAAGCAHTLDEYRVVHWVGAFDAPEGILWAKILHYASRKVSIFRTNV